MRPCSQSTEDFPYLVYLSSSKERRRSSTEKPWAQDRTWCRALKLKTDLWKHQLMLEPWCLNPPLSTCSARPDAIPSTNKEKLVSKPVTCSLSCINISAPSRVSKIGSPCPFHPTLIDTAMVLDDCVEMLSIQPVTSNVFPFESISLLQTQGQQAITWPTNHKWKMDFGFFTSQACCFDNQLVLTHDGVCSCPWIVFHVLSEFDQSAASNRTKGHESHKSHGWKWELPSCLPFCQETYSLTVSLCSACKMAPEKVTPNLSQPFKSSCKSSMQRIFLQKQHGQTEAPRPAARDHRIKLHLEHLGSSSQLLWVRWEDQSYWSCGPKDVDISFAASLLSVVYRDFWAFIVMHAHANHTVWSCACYLPYILGSLPHLMFDLQAWCGWPWFLTELSSHKLHQSSWCCLPNDRRQMLQRHPCHIKRCCWHTAAKQVEKHRLMINDDSCFWCLMTTLSFWDLLTCKSESNTNLDRKLNLDAQILAG